MKVTKWAMLIAMAGGLSATSAFAQTGLRQPSTVMRTGFEYGSYYQASAEQPAVSPSDAPVEAAPVAAAAPGCTAPGCTAGNGPTCAAPAACATDPSCNGASTCTSCQDCALECPEACEPWRLFAGHQDPCHGPIIKGWVNGGIMGNAQDPASRFNGPVTFYDRDGEAQLSQLYLIAEKALDTSNGPAFGYRLDLLYGTDYRFNLSRGLSANDQFLANWNSSRFYGLDIPQMYVELGANDTSLKIGHFYTIIGYEVVTAPDNFFMTHAYTMQYGEPFTHTGALLTQKVNDQLSIMAGITTGWDNFEDVYDELSFLGGVTLTSSDGNSKLAYALSVGEEETVFAAVSPTETRFIQSIVYSRTLTDRLNYVFQSDLGSQENANNSGDSATWYGVNQYLFYKINCCWTAGVRAEWFRDDDGYRVAPAGDYAAGIVPNSNPASVGGFEGNFYEVAFGLNYKPVSNPNLIVRPEVRYDHFDGVGVNGLPNPYDDGNSDHQFLYGIDFIYLY
jgi:hypothetical protein